MNKSFGDVEKRRTGTEMLPLNKRQLAILQDAQPDLDACLVECQKKGTRWWSMAVELDGAGKAYTMVMNTGTQKLWKYLDRVIDFVKETCP